MSMELFYNPIVKLNRIFMLSPKLSLPCFFISTILMYNVGLAQTTDSTANQDKNEFFTGITYNSALNYYGRVDSLKSSGIYPYLGVIFKNGFFLNSTFVFTHNNINSEYAATLLGAGYNFKNQQGNWAGTISGAAFLYKDNSNLAQSAVKGTGNLSITNSNKILNITLGADAKFSNQVDFGAQASLDHIFRFENIFGKGILVFDPTAAVNAGSQNFTRTYYEEKKFLLLPVGQEEITKESKRFDLLSYEFSFPVIYGIGKFNLLFTPAYVIPQNVITVPNHPELSERAENLFYFTGGIKFTF